MVFEPIAMEELMNNTLKYSGIFSSEFRNMLLNFYLTPQDPDITMGTLKELLASQNFLTMSFKAYVIDCFTKLFEYRKNRKK